MLKRHGSTGSGRPAEPILDVHEAMSSRSNFQNRILAAGRKKISEAVSSSKEAGEKRIFTERTQVTCTALETFYLTLNISDRKRNRRLNKD